MKRKVLFSHSHGRERSILGKSVGIGKQCLDVPHQQRLLLHLGEPQLKDLLAFLDRISKRKIRPKHDPGVTIVSHVCGDDLRRRQSRIGKNIGTFPDAGAAKPLKPAIQKTTVRDDDPQVGRQFVDEIQGMMPFLLENNRHIPSPNLFKSCSAFGVLIVIMRFPRMPMPLDTAMAVAKLGHRKIIPDEEEREHHEPPALKGQEVTVGPLPPHLPVGSIFKLGVIAVINFHHRREHDHPKDVASFDRGVIVFYCLPWIDVLLAAMGVRVNDGEPHRCPPMDQEYDGKVAHNPKHQMAHRAVLTQAREPKRKR